MLMPKNFDFSQHQKQRFLYHPATRCRFSIRQDTAEDYPSAFEDQSRLQKIQTRMTSISGLQLALTSGTSGDIDDAKITVCRLCKLLRPVIGKRNRSWRTG
jgi:hypothetical protein